MTATTRRAGVVPNVDGSFTKAETDAYEPPACPKCGGAQLQTWLAVRSRTDVEDFYVLDQAKCVARCHLPPGWQSPKASESKTSARMNVAQRAPQAQTPRPPRSGAWPGW